MRKRAEPMNYKSEFQSNELFGLVTELYNSILNSETFMDALESWDAKVTSKNEMPLEALEFLGDQLSIALPLLENSFKDITTKDELADHLVEDGRPSLIISTEKIVIGSNPSGRALFGVVDGDSINKCINLSQDKEHFLDLLRKAKVSNSETDYEIRQFASCCTPSRANSHLVGVRVVMPSYGDSGLLLINGMEIIISKDKRESLQSSFGLTAAEMDVIDLLLAGHGQKAIAEIRDSREDTVKKQIRSIKDKTSSKTTIALVCLIASFSQLKSADVQTSKRSITNQADQTYSMPSQHKTINVKGHRVEYCVYGAAKLRPILMVHSSMGGVVLPPSFAIHMNKRGYKIIVPMRPGYGLSDPLKGNFSIEKVAELMRDFANALNLENYMVAGCALGYCYAVALAALEPKRIKGIIGIAGYLPLEPKQFSEVMPAFQRAVFKTAGGKPSLGKFLVLGGYRLLLQCGAHTLFQKLFRNSKEDLLVCNDSDALGLLSLGTKIATAQGLEAFLKDCSLALYDWRYILDKTKQPMCLFMGTDDSIFQPKMVADFCDVYPHIELNIIENTGQLMMYAKPKYLADKIADQADRDLSW